MLVTQDSTESPRVLTWGRGQYGQLGHNSQPADEVLAPTAVPCLEGRPVARLACGQFHTAAVVAGPKGSGGVLTWGRGTLGVLGHGDEEDRLEPQAVELLTGVDVRSVACGAYQTAAVTRAGELFCWGWQFEDGPSGSIQEGYTCVPRRMEGLGALAVRHVSCGSYAAVALTTDGAAFTWGKGARGVLGHGHTRDVASPTRVGALSDTFVWDARLGKAFLLCLSAAGELFSNGAADGGVLGHGARADEAAPVRVAALEGTRVVALDCGDSHAAALTASGEVYCWGRGSHGRLGLGHSRDVPTPTRVEAMVGKTCVEVSCSSYSTACRTDTGHVWRWGGSAVAPLEPMRIRLGGSAHCVAAGGSHVAVALGEPLGDAADRSLARQVGVLLPSSQAEVAEAVAQSAGSGVSGLASLLQQTLPPDADPSLVLAQLQQLRSLLQQQEKRRDEAEAELARLQAELQEAVYEQELMREQRGAPEDQGQAAAAAAANGRGVRLLDPPAYSSMLPEEQATT